MTDRQKFISGLREIIGEAYIWGGSGKLGYDCSGAMLHGLEKTSEYGDVKDMTSHKLGYEYLRGSWIDKGLIKEGCMIFYGDKLDKITHVMAVLTVWSPSRFWLVGARGGTSATTTKEIAYEKKALVGVVRGDYWKSRQQFIVDPFKE